MPAVTSKHIADPCLLVHVFRVEEGLGNACLLQLPDGSCGFVDWGTQHSDALEQALKVVGRSTVRFVVATHAHSDHTLGIAELLRTCTDRGIVVKALIFSGSTLHKRDAHLTKAREAAIDCGIPTHYIAEDSFLAPPGERQPPCIAWGDDKSWDIRVLSPSVTDIGEDEVRAFRQSIVPGNETSLVLLFRFVGTGEKNGMGRALLPGDATPATLKYARQTAARFPGLALNNQLFLVPHHGSSKNLPKWIDQHVHGVTIVSSPTDSPHHPAKTVLKRIVGRPQGGTHLFCTSYAECCRTEFGGGVPIANQALVEPGPCFGDTIIAVPNSRPASHKESAHPGGLRRSYGHCGR